jgi:hypothetical protein
MISDRKEMFKILNFRKPINLVFYCIAVYFSIAYAPGKKVISHANPRAKPIFVDKIIFRTS